MKHEDILEKGLMDRALITFIHDSGLGSRSGVIKLDPGGLVSCRV